jgi:UDP-glucose 4-epimerase
VKIVILGATGFLGGLVTSRLAQEGHKIVCLVRNPETRDAQTNVEYILATLDDTQAVADHVRDADYLLHFAWDTTPGTSKAQPALEAVNNLLPTFRLIEQLHSLSSCQLIFVSSSGAIYDETGASSFSESSPLNPKSYYGAGKLAVEMFLRAYSAQTTHPVVLVRPSNVYGPGQQTKRQFAIVPTLMRAISDGATFSVWGDGAATRDYLYAEDFTEFFVLLTERQWEGVNTFNLASQKSCSINDLCNLLQKVSGKRLSLEYLPERGVDLHDVAIDCSRANTELGWQATTELEEGLVETWEWFVRSR